MAQHPSRSRQGTSWREPSRSHHVTSLRAKRQHGFGERRTVRARPGLSVEAGLTSILGTAPRELVVRLPKSGEEYLYLKPSRPQYGPSWKGMGVERAAPLQGGIRPPQCHEDGCIC